MNIINWLSTPFSRVNIFLKNSCSSYAESFKCKKNLRCYTT